MHDMQFYSYVISLCDVYSAAHAVMLMYISTIQRPWTWPSVYDPSIHVQNTTEKYRHRLNTDRGSLLSTIACLYFEFFVILRITRVAEPIHIHRTNTLNVTDPLPCGIISRASFFWDPSTEMCSVISRAVVIWGVARFRGNTVYNVLCDSWLPSCSC